MGSLQLQSGLPPNEVLRNALSQRKIRHPDGHQIDLLANISPLDSTAVYHCVRRERPELVVEIGMAHGISTLSILTALAENNHGRLISIDPYVDWPTGRTVALHQIEQAGFSDYHEHLHEPSYSGLPRLLERKCQPDLVYIDGHHNFDYAFTDCFLADKLLRPGGFIVFDDASKRPVFRVIRYLQLYRHYEELDVGLPRIYRSRNPLFSLIKRLQGRSNHNRYFRKLDEWEPHFGFDYQMGRPF